MQSGVGERKLSAAVLDIALTVLAGLRSGERFDFQPDIGDQAAARAAVERRPLRVE